MAAGSESLRRRATLDVAVQIVARVVNLALGVIVTAVLARTLGKAGFGQWSTILLISPLVGLFMDLGLSATTVREAVADPDNEGEWISALFVVQAVMAVPATIVSLVVVVALHESTQMLVAGLVLLALIPLSLGGVVGTVYRIHIRNSVPMAALTLNSIAWTIAVVVIKQTGGSLIALAIAMTAITAATTLGQAVIALRLVSLQRPRRQTVRRLLGVGTPLALATVLVIAYGRIDQFLVFTIAGSDEAGLYGAVYRIFDSWAFIPGSLLTTLAPVLAASWPRDRARLLRTSRLALEYLTIGSLGIVAFTIGTAEPLVRTLFGKDFDAAAPALPVLAGAFVMMSYGYLTDNLLLVMDKQRKLLAIAIGGLVVNLAANFILIPRYGFMGAAWTTLATETIVEGAAVVLLLRHLGIRRFNVDRLVRITLAAAALVLALEAARAIGAPLAALALVAAAAYPVLLIALRALRVDELTALIRRRPVAT